MKWHAWGCCSAALLLLLYTAMQQPTPMHAWAQRAAARRRVQILRRR